MAAASVPWAQFARIPLAPTQLERVRAAMVMAGVPLSAIDPTYRNQEAVSGLGEKIRSSKSNAMKLKGIPSIPGK